MAKKILNIEAQLENIDMVSAAIEEVLESVEAPFKVVNSCQLSVEELYVNVASYAYGDKSEKPCTITIDAEQNCVKIDICDSGNEFNPLEKEDPDTELSAEDRPIGGLGIFMVKKMMDEVAYERKDGMNIITLVKNW